MQDNNAIQGELVPQILSFGGVDFDDTDSSSSAELAEGYRIKASSGCFDEHDTSNVLALYKKDRIAQKIVQIPVFDALANWRDITNKQLAEKDREFDLVEVFKDALEGSRFYKAAVILPIIVYSDTGRSPKYSVPLQRLIDGERDIEISGFTVVKKNIRFSEDTEKDICSDHFDKPLKVICGELEIHYSRCFVIGDPSCSFFDSIVGYLSDFHDSFSRKKRAVKRNSSFVVKADFQEVQKYVTLQKKLNADASSQSAQSELEIIANIKAKTIFNNLNDKNVAIIGQKEDILNFQQNNIDDLVKSCEQEMQVLSGVADILITRLFGVQSKGLGNGSFQGVENYGQSLDTLRSQHVDKALRKIDQMIADIYFFEYSSDSWAWNDTKAEEMLARLRGSTQTEESKAE